MPCVLPTPTPIPAPCSHILGHRSQSLTSDFEQQLRDLQGQLRQSKEELAGVQRSLSDSLSSTGADLQSARAEVARLMASVSALEKELGSSKEDAKQSSAAVDMLKKQVCCCCLCGCVEFVQKHGYVAVFELVESYLPPCIWRIHTSIVFGLELSMLELRWLSYSGRDRRQRGRQPPNLR